MHISLTRLEGREEFSPILCLQHESFLENVQNLKPGTIQIIPIQHNLTIVHLKIFNPCPPNSHALNTVSIRVPTFRIRQKRTISAKVFCFVKTHQYLHDADRVSVHFMLKTKSQTLSHIVEKRITFLNHISPLIKDLRQRYCSLDLHKSF